ncbi:MAG: hypothetical protein WCX27_01030 [Candidatus Paceibacterota bacterium]|jgi:hypothetical protein
MSLNLSTKNNALHHAYCIVGGDDIVNELEKFLLKELKFSTIGNPDFWYGEYDVLDVDDSRKIKSLHGNRPTAGDRKIFVVKTNFITEKAQNAMLKLFEEPRGDTHFFLIIPSAHGLIETLKSRMNIVNQYGKGSSVIDPGNFLKMGMGERFEAIKKLMENISDEEKSKMEVVKFMNAIEADLHANGKKDLKVLEDIGKMRQYASEQSPSLKMILEYLALTLT